MLDLLARETANIIELARNTEALRRSERAASEAIRARGEILAVVAHDLRGPLSTVLGAAQNLAVGMKSLPAEPQTERMLKSVGSIRKSVARMIRLTNDLLDLSSIDAHQLHLEIRPEPPRELVAEAVDAHGTAAAEHRIRLVVSVEEGLPFVRCDREAPGDPRARHGRRERRGAGRPARIGRPDAHLLGNGDPRASRRGSRRAHRPAAPCVCVVLWLLWLRP